MKNAQFWIDHLQLLAHPEGGYYRESYRSEEMISSTALPDRFSGSRNFSTAIYFLLRSDDRSLFHRIKSDELWHFHYGGSLEIYVLQDDHLTIHKLGPNPEKGEHLQVVIPANCWFGAKVYEQSSYTLSSCTVAPGFDFTDFELASASELIRQFPDFKTAIDMLT